jgi:hypothetical protein
MDGWTSGQLAWSPDGMKIAFTGPSSPTIYVGDATKGYGQEL